LTTLEAVRQSDGSVHPVSRPETLLPWLALGVALSPALMELGRHLGAHPWSRYVLVPLLMLAWSASRAEPPAPAPSPASSARRLSLGAALLLCALVLEFWGLFAGPPQVARLSLPVGFLGMACWVGRPPLGSALLSIWLVPVPYFLVRSLAPALLPVMQGLSSVVLGAFGSDDAVVALERQDGGLLMAALLSSIGWFGALGRGSSLPGCALSAGLWGACGFAVQWLAIIVGALVFGQGETPGGRVWLDQGAPALVALCALAFTAWRATAAPRSYAQ